MRKVVSIFILVCFLITGQAGQYPVFVHAANAFDAVWQPNEQGILPRPGEMVHLSPEFSPAYLKGIVVHPEDPFKFDFIIYKGDRPLSDAQKREEYTKLTKYFLASLAIPDDDQWVNLSPYEKDRIIKDDFGKTEMGRDLLAQDYMLKQITASLIYPEDKLGKEFWAKVYAQAQKQYGTTNVPVNTFNKVWIVPDSALIYEKGNMAYVVNHHLKVMLEEDYLSLQKHTSISTVIPAKAGIQTHTIASKIVREIVLPELQREVNEDKNFSPLRQVYSGMILAAWFKRTLKESLLGRIYANKSKVRGVDQDPKTNEEIYRQYLKAYKKGVFNFIKEDVDRYTNETVPRKYFSGGLLSDGAMYSQEVKVTHDWAMARQDVNSKKADLDVADASMLKAGVEMPGLNAVISEEDKQGTAKYTRAINYFHGEPRQKAIDDFRHGAVRVFRPDGREIAKEKLETLPEGQTYSYYGITFGDLRVDYVLMSPRINQAMTAPDIESAIFAQIQRIRSAYESQLAFIHSMNKTQGDGLLAYRRTMPPEPKITIFYKKSIIFGPQEVTKIQALDVKEFLDGADFTFSKVDNNFIIRDAAMTAQGEKKEVSMTATTGSAGPVIGQKTFRQILRDRLNKKGMTQIQFADMIGVTAEAVMYWLTGRKSPNEWRIELIAQVLEITTPNDRKELYQSLGLEDLTLLVGRRTFGQMLRYGLNKKNMSLKGFVGSMGVNRWKVIEWLYHNRMPQKKRVTSELIAKILEFTPDEVKELKKSLGLDYGVNSTVINNPGGIDLNSANLGMMIKRDGKGVVLPLAQQDLAQLSNIEGLEPEILAIIPASQSPVFAQLQTSP